jgi:hypothetical protein
MPGERLQRHSPLWVLDVEHAPTAWLIASQSSTRKAAPSARSAMICTTGRSLPLTCTRTSS